MHDLKKLEKIVEKNSTDGMLNLGKYDFEAFSQALIEYGEHIRKQTIGDFTEKIQERANDVPPNLLLNEVINIKWELLQALNELE